ncbi:MAG: hypothetical protein CMF94_02925 [Candidatus Marinimicrobia bacterium]|nr:hypothetical protein [Candidatus Neomarinimicrobiota bacterium]
MTRTYKKHKARINVIIVSTILSWLCLCIRLFQVQILNGSEYKSAVIVQSQTKQIQKPSRGNFFDRDNRPLSRNIFHYTLSANPKEVKNKFELAKEISLVTGKPVEKYIKKLNSKKSFEYLERNLLRKQIGDLISINYNGLTVEKSFRRFYPHNKIAAQLIGYTNSDNQGISGLEKYFEDLLKGEHGWVYKTKGLSGKIQHKSGMPFKKPINGNNIQLTIDLEYQSVLEEELFKRQIETEAISATGIILNPQNGEILALASTPGFDNNYFHKSDPSRHRIKAITDQFEPGSTYKVVSAISALVEKKITPHEEFNCENGEYEYYTIPIRDHQPYSMLSASQIIQHSSNIGIIKIIEKAGPKALYSISRDFGFGSRTGIKLDGEIKGTLNPFINWSAVSLGQIAMGHEVGVTAIQLAMAYCAIANGGYLLKPKLIRQVINDENLPVFIEKPIIVRKIADEKTMREIKNMLRNVILDGTGVNAGISGWKVAGKTGTAQKWLNGKYSDDKFISNFVGFFPEKDPQLLSLIILDEPKQPYHWGGQGAAVAFKRVMSRIINMDDSISPPLHAKNNTNSNFIENPKKINAKPVRDDKKNNLVALSTKTKISNKVKVPELRGLSMRKAMSTLRDQGIESHMNGSGKVAWQSPKPGTYVEIGTICKVGLN